MQIYHIIADIDLSQMPVEDIFSIGVAAIGLLFLFIWFARNGGVDSLSSAPRRQNSMPYFLPFAAMMLWIMLSFLVGSLTTMIARDMEPWVEELISYAFVIAVSTAMLLCFLFTASRFFTGGLKGFGLNHRTILRDIGAALVNYITVMPLVLIGLWAVMIIGILIYGSDFQMTQHESLSVMTGDSPLMLKITAALLAVLFAPLLEEVLFRGLFQSAMVTITSQPWFSIVVTSLFFVMLHPPKHWPALFALSACMGYTYEKSGSLYRAIFLHMIFNGVSTAAALFAS